MSSEEASLLCKSLKFNITREVDDFTKIDFTTDVEMLVQKIKFAHYHSKAPSPKLKSDENDQMSTPIAKNKSDKRTSTYNPSILKLHDQIKNMVEKRLEAASKVPVHHNTSTTEREAMKALSKNYDIVIREADKGSAVVLMDKDFHLKIANKMLQTSNYTKCGISIDDAVKHLVKIRQGIIKTFRSILLTEEIDYIENFDSCLGHWYLNPKVHKSQSILHAMTGHSNTLLEVPQPDDLTFRPIASGTKCPLKRLSAIAQTLLEPFTTKVKSFTRDTWDLLEKLPATVEKGTTLISLDVKDLYTNIDNILGLEAVEYYMDKYPELVHPRLGKNFLLHLLKELQNNIYFEFNDTVYKQTNGCAMGREYGPPWATLSVGYLEETKLYPAIRQKFPPAIAEQIIEQYRRYQDDILLINQHNVDSKQLLDLFNDLHPLLKFLLENFSSTIPFLDVLIKIIGLRLETSIYHKPTDSFNYLHFASNHPSHIKRNIPYSLARRIKGIVSTKKERIAAYIDLKRRLQKKSYPSKLINDAVIKAEQTPRSTIINCNSTKNAKEITTLVTTHHPILDNIGKAVIDITKEANLPCLSRKRIIHSKRQPPNLKRILTRTNSYAPAQPKEVKMCGRKKCGLCKNGYNNLLTGRSIKLKNGMILKPNKNINCDTKNVNYCLICPKCKEFYIGQCKILRKRMNLHRDHSNPSSNKTPPLQVNRHLKKCSGGYFHVFPFFVVPTHHQISRETYEAHFQAKFKPTLH